MRIVLTPFGDTNLDVINKNRRRPKDGEKVSEKSMLNVRVN